MPNLSNLVKPGDLLFVNNTTLVSKIIKKITESKSSHVGIVYDKDTIFETDLAWGKAELRPLSRYNDMKVLIVRLNQVEEQEEKKIKELCKKYNGTPYSVWDIITNLMFSPLKDSIREKLVGFTGTKKFAICSELSARILFEATKYGKLARYEGLTPQDLITITRLNWPDWEIVLNRL